MRLYEICTGHYGESYERCYVWATSEEQARSIFDESEFGKRKKIKELSLLFSGDSNCFITRLSDNGFGEIITPQ